MATYVNGYEIRQNPKGNYEVVSGGNNYVVQVEPTKGLAVLWTYAELYRVMKEEYGG